MLCSLHSSIYLGIWVVHIQRLVYKKVAATYCCEIFFRSNFSCLFHRKGFFHAVGSAGIIYHYVFYSHPFKRLQISAGRPEHGKINNLFV